MSEKKGLSKEAFIFETVLKLIHSKNLEVEHGFKSWATKTRGIGWDKDDPKLFKITAKTKWQALKTLEKEGYIKRVGHDLYLTDEVWDRIKTLIIKFHVVRKTTE